VAVDEDIELPGTTGLEFDLGDAATVQRIPHPEGFGPVASSAAVLDKHLQSDLRGSSLLAVLLIAAW